MPLPRIFNTATGQWEEISPEESEAEYGIPIGAPPLEASAKTQYAKEVPVAEGFSTKDQSPEELAREAKKNFEKYIQAGAEAIHPEAEAQALPKGQRPTTFNPATGRFEEVSPAMAAQMAVPLGPPRTTEEHAPEGGVIFSSEPWHDAGAQATPQPDTPQLFASTEKGVPAGYKPPAPITPSQEERDRLLKADQERRAQQQSSTAAAPTDQASRGPQAEVEGYMSRLKPDVQPYTRNLLGALNEHFKDTGIEVRIHSGYRTPQEQDELYKVGRRGIKGEEVITNAKGGQSEHQGGRAVDIGLYRNGQYIDDPKDPLYKEIGPIGEKLGFTWGGKFKSIYDPAHFQLPTNAPGITTEVRKAQGVKDNTQPSQPVYTFGPKPKGLVEEGNLDIRNRPIVHNPDGSISTEYSFSRQFDGKEVLIPHVVNGKMLSDEEAIAHYKKTGENLGKFDSPESADAYAESLHNRPDPRYQSGPAQQPGQPAPAPSAPGQPVPAGSPAHLTQVRQQALGNQLSPRQVQMLFASTEAEVGDQPDRVRQMYMESVLNRYANPQRGYHSLEEAVSDPHYYPQSTLNKLGRRFSGAQYDHLNNIFLKVLNGSNVSNFSTGNESGNVHSGGAPVVANPGTGERFVAENADLDFLRRLGIKVQPGGGKMGGGGATGAYSSYVAPDRGPKPAGPGFYIWPTADRASPEEIQAARYPAMPSYGYDPHPGLGVNADIAEPHPSLGINPNLTRQDQPAPQPLAIQTYGYDPHPGLGINPDIAEPHPSLGVNPNLTRQDQAAVTPPALAENYQQLVGQPQPQRPWSYGTGSVQPEDAAQPPQTASQTAAAAAPAQVTPPAQAPAAKAPPAQPQPQGEEYTPEWQRSLSPADQEKHIIGLHDAFNLFARGAASENVLSKLEGVYAAEANNLPNFPIFDHVRKNAREQANAVAEARQWIKEHTPVPRDVEESIVGRLLSFGGMVAPDYAIGALSKAVPGGPVLASALNYVGGAAQAYDMQRQDAIATMKAQGKPVDEAAANRAALKGLAVMGPMQIALGRLRLNSVLNAVAKEGGTVAQAKKAALAFVVHGGIGGSVMGVQTLWQNAVAKSFEGYDPKRPLNQGMIESIVTGFVGQGLADTAASHLAGMHAERKAKATKAELGESAGKLGEVKVPDTGAELSPEEQAAFQKGEGAKPPPIPPSSEPPSGGAPAKPPTEPIPGGVKPGFEYLPKTPEEPPSGAGAPETTPPTPSAPAPSTPEEAPARAQQEADLRARGYNDAEVKAALGPEAPPEEVKYSKNVPPETVKIKTFDRKARDFAETEMEPSRDLHEQLKREENLYTTLINCL